MKTIFFEMSPLSEFVQIVKLQSNNMTESKAVVLMLWPCNTDPHVVTPQP